VIVLGLVHVRGDDRPVHDTPHRVATPLSLFLHTSRWAARVVRRVFLTTCAAAAATEQVHAVLRSLL
jgi:hypothetical protein